MVHEKLLRKKNGTTIFNFGNKNVLKTIRKTKAVLCINNRVKPGRVEDV
jgi:hypothetical protein